MYQEDTSKSETLRHYGYGESSTAPSCGIWRNDEGVLDRLGELPQVLRLYGAEKNKIRVVFDYDPDYGKSVLQIWGLELASLFHDMSSHEEKPGK